MYFEKLWELPEKHKPQVERCLNQTKELAKLYKYAQTLGIKFFLANSWKFYSFGYQQISLKEKDFLTNNGFTEMSLAHEIGHYLEYKEGLGVGPHPLFDTARCPYKKQMTRYYKFFGRAALLIKYNYCQIIDEDTAWRKGLRTLNELNIKYHRKEALRFALYYLNTYISGNTIKFLFPCLTAKHCISSPIFNDSIIKESLAQGLKSMPRSALKKQQIIIHS